MDLMPRYEQSSPDIRQVRWTYEKFAVKDRWSASSCSLVAAGLASCTVFFYRDVLADAISRWWLGEDGRPHRAKPLRRRLKVAVLGAGIGGSAVALWLRDAFGDEDVDIMVISDGEIGGRCHSVEFDGNRYEAGASIVSSTHLRFRGLMERFALQRLYLPGLHSCFSVFGNSRFLFQTSSAGEACGSTVGAQFFSALRLAWHFGLNLKPLFQLGRMACSSATPNTRGLHHAQCNGATFAHPRELLSALGHCSLRFSEHSAEHWLVKELGLPKAFVDELATPSMRSSYGGQGCADLHTFVAFLTFCGSFCRRCFGVRGGTEQVSKLALEAAKPRVIQGSARLVRRIRAERPCDPSFEVGYDASVFGEVAEAMKASTTARTPRSPGSCKRAVGEAEGLLLETFHIVVVAHPLEQSTVVFEGCGADAGLEKSQAAEAVPPPQFRRCAAQFVHGTLNLRRFCGIQADEVDAEGVVPAFSPIQVVTTSDTDAPFYSVSLQIPLTCVQQDAEDIIASAERGEAQVFKVLAPRPLSEDELSEWFVSRQEGVIATVDWYACPQYGVPQTFRPFVLDAEGVYYVNAIEQVASSMEMSLVGARNSVNMILEWVDNRRCRGGF